MLFFFEEMTEKKKSKMNGYVMILFPLWIIITLEEIFFLTIKSEFLKSLVIFKKRAKEEMNCKLISLYKCESKKRKQNFRVFFIFFFFLLT